MLRFSFFAFSIWFLLLPFTIITGLYLNVLSIDKQIAPFLILLWIFLSISGQSSLSKEKLTLIFLALLFFFVRNISFIDNTELYTSSIWRDTIFFGYFCLPILFVDNVKKIQTAGRLVAISATVGCVSAFMVALGWLTLPYERFSQSRIGFDIQKSIGLFSSYGDLVQYSAYFLLLATFMPVSLLSRKKLLLRIIAFTIIIMGLIGNQSRSFLLAIIIALLMAFLFSFRSKKSGSTLPFNLMILISGSILMVIIAFSFTDIVNMLAGLGGSQAQKTAEGRLVQYQMAFNLIKEFPVFGVDSAIFAKNSEYIHGIHNMWLGQMTRGGITSTILLLGLLFMIFQTSLHLFNNPKTKPYGICAIGYLFAVLVSTLFYPADTSLFWALLGMIAAIVTTLRSSKLTP